MTSVGDVLARLEAHGLLISATAPTEIPIAGIADDSRQVRPGYMFCAIRGHSADGHRFLDQAVSAGAAAALVEESRGDIDIPQYVVSDGRRAAAIAAQVVYGDPAGHLTLIGVTGTNGKTTTVHILRHVLSGRWEAGSVGTLGVILPSGECRSIELTTPGPVMFARILAELRDAGADLVVSEVSSHALVQHRVDGVEFDIAVFTNLSRDHLDYHESLQEYRDVKLRLARRVVPGGTIVMNADEPAWEGFQWTGRKLTYGVDSAADFRAEEVELGPEGSSWTLQAPDSKQRIRLPLLGRFNLSNALAAAAAASASGVDLASIGRSLATVPPVPGRLEVLSREPLVLRDYAHTPDALRRAIEGVRPLLRGRLIVLFGCGGDRDRGKRPLMGKVAAEGADLTIVTSDNPRTEPPAAIVEEIIPGLGDAPHERIVDRRQAIARALEIAKPGDAVLLAGKGHETYQVVGRERRPFDEKKIVASLLGGGESGR